MEAEIPEERPGELHPALLRRHLQRQRNQLLPPGPDTQPQPPGRRTANHQEVSKEEEELKMKDLMRDSYLKRISEFMEALRS